METLGLQHESMDAAAAASATSVRSKSKPVSSGRKKFKGHGWSKSGSKKQRATARKARKAQWFYAVAIGYRPGIYLQWPDAKAQVHGFSDPKYQKFKVLRKAQEFMHANRLTPPGIRTPFPPQPQTPLPPSIYVYSTASFTPTVVCAPKTVWPHEFESVKLMADRIAQKTSNRILDPPCTDPDCPYSRGDLMSQRFALLQRLYQLNAQLGCDPDDSDEDDRDGNRDG